MIIMEPFVVTSQREIEENKYEMVHKAYTSVFFFEN